jgi:hypothetical protein
MGKEDLGDNVKEGFLNLILKSSNGAPAHFVDEKGRFVPLTTVLAQGVVASGYTNGQRVIVYYRVSKTPSERT